MSGKDEYKEGIRNTWEGKDLGVFLYNISIGIEGGKGCGI